MFFFSLFVYLLLITEVDRCEEEIRITHKKSSNSKNEKMENRIKSRRKKKRKMRKRKEGREKKEERRRKREEGREKKEKK